MRSDLTNALFRVLEVPHVSVKNFSAGLIFVIFKTEIYKVHRFSEGNHFNLILYDFGNNFFSDNHKKIITGPITAHYIRY